MILPGFGEASQQKLCHARVLVIGAGGLGCPVLLYLAAAGIGHITIADDDAVSLSNLHRQVLFTMKDIGQPKARVAKERLMELNPELDAVAVMSRWDQRHCLDFFPAFDLIIDATDNFPTRYLINDGAVLTGKPVVSGAISRWQGQVTVLNMHVGNKPAIHYRDIFPNPPKQGEVQDCAEAGVVGMLAGVIGSMQAVEAIKIITGIGQTLAGRLLTYDARTQESFMVDLIKNSDSDGSLPADEISYLNTNYEWFCGQGEPSSQEISLEAWLAQPEECVWIDVRELHEGPSIEGFFEKYGMKVRKIPLRELVSRHLEWKDENIIFICQTGVRSAQACNIAHAMDTSISAKSLQGGVEALIRVKII